MIQKQHSLFIELILSRAENEIENENENNHEIENDEIENENKQQRRKKFNKYTKTNDAKSENVLNRLRFIKLKSEKKKFLSRRNVFFFLKMRARLHRLFARIEISKEQARTSEMKTRILI